jgi:hypothetical protein
LTLGKQTHSETFKQTIGWTFESRKADQPPVVTCYHRNALAALTGIVRSLQSTYQTYSKWHTHTVTTLSALHADILSAFAALPPSHEWISFAARSSHLLDPEMPLCDPMFISYLNKENPAVLAVHTGNMMRKRWWTRAWREGWFILTPAGFLHKFVSSDGRVGDGKGWGGGPVGEKDALEPVWSLFLPMCTLGPQVASGSKSWKFHIEAQVDGSGTLKGGSIRQSFHSLTGSIHAPGSLHSPSGAAGSGYTNAGGNAGGNKNKNIAWSFRTKSREEMLEWWNNLKMLCTRYLAMWWRGVVWWRTRLGVWV